jgi:hypothetical protein
MNQSMTGSQEQDRITLCQPNTELAHLRPNHLIEDVFANMRIHRAQRIVCVNYWYLCATASNVERDKRLLMASNGKD